MGCHTLRHPTKPEVEACVGHPGDLPARRGHVCWIVLRLEMYSRWESPNLEDCARREVMGLDLRQGGVTVPRY